MCSVSAGSIPWPGVPSKLSPLSVTLARGPNNLRSAASWQPTIQRKSKQPTRSVLSRLPLAVEQFPDADVHGAAGGHLYLHADEDGVGMSLRGHRGSLSVAWRAHRVQHGGATRVLLLGAAYGRYLVVRPETAPPPGIRARRACRAVQCAYDAPEQDDVLWEAADAGDADGGGGAVLMRHHRYGLWYDHGDPSTAVHWQIEAVFPRDRRRQHFQLLR